MATYCTSDDVSNQLQRGVFTNLTTPTKIIIENMIERNEDLINSYTGHSWKVSTITKEYVNPKISEPSLGLRFDLSHRKIRDFTTGTDKFEVFNGSIWYEYIENNTEGRLSDYFVDYTNGVVWLRKRNSIYPHGVRFTYRYGDSTVNKAISKACILLTAIDVLNMLDRAATFVEDGSSNRPTHDMRINNWKEEAYRILDSMKEFRTL